MPGSRGVEARADQFDSRATSWVHPARCETQLAGWEELRTRIEDADETLDVSPSVEYGSTMHTAINVQSLTLEAILTGDRRHVYHAAMFDPHTAADLDLDQIWQLVDELVDAHGDYIPESLRSVPNPTDEER